MGSDRPECKEFVIAAIRTIRKNPPNRKPGTEAGVAIRRLFGVVQEKYSGDEFHDALKILLSEDRVVIAAAIYERQQKTKRKDFSIGRVREVLISEIPEKLPAGKYGLWRLDERGSLVGARKTRYLQVIRARVFVKEDGLSDKLLGLIEGKQRPKTADQIIRSMQNEKT